MTKNTEIMSIPKDTVWEKAEELKQPGQQAVNQQLDRVSQTAEAGKKKVQEY